MHKNIRIPYIKKCEVEDKGYKDHINMARRRLIAGAARNGKVFARAGFDCSFKKSFSASAKGWGNPIIPTLFGPFRI